MMQPLYFCGIQMTILCLMVLFYSTITCVFSQPTGSTTTESPTRDYTFTLSVYNNVNSGSTDEIWFRLQGSIKNVTNNETWTEWFTHGGFTQISTSYIFTKSLTNVGDAQKMILLSTGTDELNVGSIAVDDDDPFDFSSYIQLNYDTR